MGDWLLQTLDTLLNANCTRSRRASCGQMKQRPFPWCQEMSSQSWGHRALVHQGFQEQRAVRAHCPGPLQLLGSPSRLGVRCSSDCPSCLAKASGPQGCFPWREGTGRDGMGWDSHLLLPTPEGCLFSVQCCVAAETFSASSVTLPYAKFVKSCSHFFFSL